MLFALAASAVCGLVFGAVPALQGSDVNGQQALAGIRGGGTSARSHRLRRGLIVVETALAIVLLTGAGLMIRTLQFLVGTDPGFRTTHLLTTRFSVYGDQAKPEVLPTLLDEITARVRAVPGVESAALTLSLPIDGSQWNSVFIVSGQPVPDRAHLKSAAFNPVGVGYFETMSIRLLRGRTLRLSDTAASARVVVVNEHLAKEMWPGADAVGKSIKQSWPEDPSPWREVVGVVAAVKLNGLIEDPPLQVYVPAAQDPSNSMVIVARTTIDPLAVAPAVEAAVHTVNKDMPLYTTRSMDQVLASSIARQRMSVLIFATFALVALVIAAVGVYGVVAQSVTERTHEIGVRMALGAKRRHVLLLVVRQGLTMTLAGIAAGVVCAAALSKTIESLLVGVPPTDPATFAGVVTVLFAVAGVASYVPAWRAARVDPTRALRAE
jgi:putative ABC transport system permease protein